MRRLRRCETVGRLQLAVGGRIVSFHCACERCGTVWNGWNEQRIALAARLVPCPAVFQRKPERGHPCPHECEARKIKRPLNCQRSNTVARVAHRVIISNSFFSVGRVCIGLCPSVAIGGTTSNGFTTMQAIPRFAADSHAVHGVVWLAG